jgi:hypothetical protein
MIYILVLSLIHLAAGAILFPSIVRDMKKQEPKAKRIREELKKYYEEERKNKDEEWLRNPKRFNKQEKRDRLTAQGHYERWVRTEARRNDW